VTKHQLTPCANSSGTVQACALRLLMPELDTAPGDYIALSVGAESAYSPEGRRKRETARAALEAALVKTFRTAPRRPA
jgi:hypothetical protein